MKKKKKRRLKKGPVIGLVMIILGIVCLTVFLTKGKKSKKTIDPVKVVDSLDSYGYTLDENESNLYKEYFKSLKEELNKEEVDEEEYAKLISQLFLSDFFHLANKISHNDIGGTQFVYEAYQNDFEKYAKESIYQTVESNIYGDRKQELPEVSDVTVKSVEQASYSYLDEKDSKAYVVTAQISYVKDMGYQTEATLTLIHQDNKLEIVKMEY